MTAWLWLALALGSAHAADGLTTAAAQGRGAWEFNTRDFGSHHPSNGRIAATESLYFGAEMGALAFTERSRHRSIRWAGRAGALFVSGYFAHLAVHNAGVCRHGCR